MIDTIKLSKAIETLRDFSYKLDIISKDKNALVTQLNSISEENRKALFSTYLRAEGPVKNIRKQVAEILAERDILVSELELIINSSVTGNPRSFNTMYKTWFNMLYMFLIADFKPAMYEAIDFICQSIISELELDKIAIAKKFDYTGERETGSTRCWIAIINSSHHKQTTAKQLFINIQEGAVEYCIYDRPNDQMLQRNVVKSGEQFNVSDMFELFRAHRDEIINDIWIPKVNYWRIGTTDEESSYWEEMLGAKKVCIGWPVIGDLNTQDVRSKKDVIKLFENCGYYSNDKRMQSRKAGEVFNFFEKIKVDDIILAQDGATGLGIGKINGEYSYNSQSGFPHQKSVEWLRIDPGIWNDNIGKLTTIFQIEDQELINKINQKIREEPIVSGNSNNLNNSVMNVPLNQIFFGPPGTGKTLAMQGMIKQFKLEQASPAHLDYKSFVADYHWWQVVAMVLLENGQMSVSEILESDLIKAKFSISDIKHPRQRIWSTLQNHTVLSCPNVKFQGRSGELIFYKELDSTWRVDNPIEIKQQFPYLLEDWDEFKSLASNIPPSKNYFFTTCHQSLTYEDFIEGIKPDLDSDKNNEDEKRAIKYIIRKGLFYTACEKAAELAGYSSLNECLLDSKEDRKEKFDYANANNKKFVLFLDEINRCNVSAVFGELITLIEEDKRLGAKYEIADTRLPYSQMYFGVPSNLMIIGTMNTADRSVEALDTALRRRFVFEEMPPLYTLDGLQYELEGISAFSILQTLNNRIEKLIDKDHQLGHSYFLLKKDEGIKQKLVNAIYKNIIPLLQEYFFGDYGKIGLVLGNGFIRQKEWSKTDDSFADFEYSNNTDFESREVFEIIDYRQPDINYSIKTDKGEVRMDFEKAMKLLMKQPIG